MQYQLSHGLARIRQFVGIEPEKARHNLLATWSERHIHPGFLSSALREAAVWGIDQVLAEFESEDEDEFIPKPWFKDEDSGPEDAWRWAHQAEKSRTFVYSPSNIQLREWSYVMWDRRRLDEWCVFEQAWNGYVDIDEFEQVESVRRLEEQGMLRPGRRL
ncbi:hypothetical protein AJ79_05846 [Helicocarpus griseus UAMH5409]|uniref:Uncharacterized protein n=1 Tax=Helicocarpus griseus UAMH5409 TaxID=1447875 RepID=A0A2B7XJI5_9EURO|nr:hypothetical protein AJ79_05846 [Helicocarpus griseus UAMH5409]